MPKYSLAKYYQINKRKTTISLVKNIKPFSKKKNKKIREWYKNLYKCKKQKLVEYRKKYYEIQKQCFTSTDWLMFCSTQNTSKINLSYILGKYEKWFSSNYCKWSELCEFLANKLRVTSYYLLHQFRVNFNEFLTWSIPS